MRRTVPRRSWALGALVAIAALAIGQLGAGPLTSKQKKAEKGAPKVDESVGDLAEVSHLGGTTVEGVGLVSGLDGTGGDSPQSLHRDQLVDEMGKAGVDHASRLLESKQFALVIVRMHIPTGASPKDRFDVELELPPASSVKSLSGGYLMATRLREVLHVKEGAKMGSDLAVATGPVMIGDGSGDNDAKPAAKKAGAASKAAVDPKAGPNPKIGRVLGGGRVKKSNPYKLVLKADRRFFRNSKMVEDAVNRRFTQNDHGQEKGASTAKTDTYLELRVPDVYHQNQDRFFRVVQLLPMIDTPELREKRMAVTMKELLDPKTSGVAALKLEALGPAASQALEAGLKSEDPHVRFFSAEALAYLDESAGVSVLGETAVSMKLYRAYALAALAAMEDYSARVKLRKLMDEPEMEIRYGAFNALRTSEPTDAMLGQVRILDDPGRNEAGDEDGADSMAMAIIASKKARPEDPFSLYIVDSEGPPALHVSRSRRSEIVVFGREQNLLPPLVLGNADILLNAADHDDGVDISKIVPDRFGNADIKVRSSLDVGEVVRHVARLGATYPEVVAVIEAAEKQKNLPGPLYIDSVPQANMQYLNKALLGKDDDPKEDAEVKQASGSFLRRMFPFRGRGEEESRPGADAEKKPDDQAAPAAKSPADAKAPADAKSPADAKAPAKKDDALQKTSAGEPEADGGRRPRILDVFRRRSE